MLSTLSNKLYAQPGASLHFDRFNTVVQAPNVPFGNNWTVEIWAYSTYTNTGWYALIGQNYWNNNQGFVLATYDGTVFVNTPQGVYMTTSFSSNVWTHLALTYDNGIFAFYKNGILVGTQVAPFTNATTPLDIGCRTQNTGSSVYNWFEGYLDEARVWTVTRSQCDIQAYMNCEIPGNATGLYSNYHFNQGTGGGINTAINYLTDATSGGHTASLTGFLLSGATRNWETPSPFVSGFSTPTASSPEIDVIGNGVSIPDGTSVSSLANNTDFGTSPTRVFTIQSTGVNTLNAGVPIFTGPNLNEFAINIPPTQILPALTGSTSFQAVFTPTSAGAKTATLSIYNSDCSEPWYDFVVTATAVAASALNFDGVDDYVQMSDPNFGTGDFTIESWIKPTSAAGGFIATSRSYEGGPSGNWWTFGYGSGNIGLEFAAASVGYTTTGTTSGSVTPGVWSHVAVVRSGTTIYLYINGNLSSTTVLSGIHNLNTGNNVVRFGGWPDWNGGWLNGSLDEIRMWDVARTQCEIQTFMNCEIATTPANLVGNYHFNQGVDLGVNTAITTLTDASASTRNGTLINFGLVSLPTSNWVTPGGVTSGSTTANTPNVEIDVRGNGNSIIDGNTSTSVTDFTDFNGALTRTFTIHNTLTGTLGIAPPYLTGTNANQFSITTIPASSIAGVGSTTLVVTFSPTSAGTKTAIINIPNGDCNEFLYDFVITATPPSGEVLNFDGVNDFINIPHNALLNITNSITVESWIKTTSSSERYITTKYDDSWYLAINGAGAAPGKASFYLNNPGPTISWLHGTSTVSDGNWHHIAGTYDGTVMKIYVDGKLENQAVKTTSLSITTGTNPLQIGARTNGITFQGSMDEVRIWNTARSQCEIQSYMNCEIPTTASGLVLNYHFNQGAAGLNNSIVTTLSDAASGLSGTLSGFLLNGSSSNWIAPSNVVTGYTTAVAPTASITLTGNGNPIAAGSTTTSLSNFTDFGSTTTKTFVIQNGVSGTLNIGSPYLTGINASEFSLSILPSSTLGVSGTTSFVVAFTPTTGGIRTATLNINDNDCSIPIFKFTIQGTPPPSEALNFDGSNDYIIVTGHTLNAQPFTIEFYAKRNSNLTQDYVYGQGTSATNAGLHLGFYASPLNFFNFGFWNNDLDVPHSDFLWHHWACVYDPAATGNNRFVYRDGILVGSNTNTIGVYTGTGLSTIGSTPWNTLGDAFDGSIDELRIWNVARSQCEIQTYMGCEIPTTATGLVANYHFNQGAAGLNNSGVTTLTDVSSTPHNGTLNNFGLTGTSSNWIAPGGVVYGYTTTSAPTASITLTGNGNTILNNSTSPTTLNLTDFGSTTTSTFVIKNSALSGTLNIGTPFITGANASSFSITVLPSSSLTTLATTTFVVVFTPTAGGTNTAIINIIDNDCNIPIFNFEIQGTPLPASALNFDGVDDFIAISYTQALTNITDEFWFKTTQATCDIFSIVNTSVNPIAFDRDIYLNSGNITAYLWLGASSQIISTTGTNFSDGAWHHVAYVINAEGQKLYVDGVLRASGSGTASGNTSGYFVTLGYGPGSVNQYFNGSIDEVRLWNVARTQCEIQSFMNCEIPSSAPGLTANYHFNQGAAGLSNATQSILIDAAGTNNGTLSTFNLTGLTSNWVTPGGVVSGSTAINVPTAVLAIKGNGNSIPAGSVSTSTTNFTDFGGVSTRTFVAQNTAGSGTLYLNSVVLSGANASEFSFTTTNPGTLTSLATTSCMITFTPTSLGTKTAIVTINSSDCANPNYSFVITASTSPASALNFDGVDDFVDIGGSFTQQAFTAEMWLNPASTQTPFANIIDNNHSNFQNWTVEQSSSTNNTYSFICGQPAGLTSVNFSLTANAWQHLAVVKSLTDMKVYVNGILIATAPWTGTINYTSQFLRLGKWGGATPRNWNGSMDELRLWSTVRTQCEIQTYMNCEIPTTSPGLIANYHFNEGIPSGSNTAVITLTDAAGSYPGTLTNFALTGAASNWINPGPFANGYSTTIVPTGTMTVSGNGNNVPQGTATSTNNFTDFSTNTSRTFVIQNPGLGPVYINSGSFSGANASSFSLTTLPSTVIAGSGTSNFVISFTPTAVGSQSAILTINSSDCANPNYSFVITASTSPASALNLSGSGEFVSLPGSATVPIGNSPYTIEAWIKPNNFANYGIIGWGNYGTTNQVNAFRMGTGGALINYWWGNDLGVSVPTLTNGAWNHVAATFDGITRSIYVDGILAGSDNPTGHSVPNNNNLKIGVTCTTSCSGGPEFFNGSMDELRVWNVGRSQCQILQFMNCEIPTTAPGLVANYHFNQGIPSGLNASYTTAIDAAGSNTGTLTGFALVGGSSNWVSPGPFANGYTTAIAPTGTITITGNGNNIPMGSATSTTNFTDFGISPTRSFVITNPGSGTLFINSVSLSGVNASSFSVTTLPNTSLTTLGTTSFVVAFTPTALGIQSTTLTINSSDCTSPNYSFVITATAVAGAALNFDGVDDYARGTVFNTLTNNLTLQARVNWNGIVATNKVIAYNGNSGTNGYGFFVAANSNSVFVLYGGINQYYSGFTLTPNQWTYLSTVIETNKISFYANGVLTTTLASATPVVPTGSFNIGTGIVTAAEPFNGSIDEVLLWSKALAQCEIQAYLSCEIATSSPSLIANYHFNQGIGAGVNTTVTSLTDASGNNNNLTLSNFAKTGTSSNFISTGAVTSGSSCGVFIASEINLVGNALSIVDGDNTPSTSDNTDFGAVCSNTIIVKTFTIQNTGNGPLAISNMSMSGVNATSFSIGVLTPASPIPSNTFAVFSVTFAPGVAGIKTATVNISNNDCDEGLYDFVITGTANVIPTVTASISNSVVCAGTSVTLTGSGADTYTWSPLVPNGVGFIPTINQLYTLSGTYTLTGCTNTNLATKAVTVNALPVMAITAVNPVICSGNIATLTASGSGTGGTYTWNPNALNGATINPTPSLTTTYSVVGTSSASCISTNVVTQVITVNTTPTLTATSVNTVICAGFTATLSVNGANTYSWFPGPLTGGTITPSPGSTTSYTVTGYGSTGCISSNSIVLTVTVNALPSVTASTSQSLICNTGTTSLIGSGATTYTWSGGIPTVTNGVVFSPSTTLSYTLSGTNALTGCTSTNLAVQTISVNPTPSITASAPSSVICNGATATLIAAGAASYTWMPGTIIGATVNPATTTLTTYTVVGTSSLGCTSTNVAVQTISVNALPSVTASISSSVTCLGGTVMVNGLGADTYTWNNGVNDGISFTPAASGNYSVSGTSTLTGCTSTNITSVSLIVNTLPTLTITGTSSVICFGGSVTLSGSGALTYTWSNGISDNILFSPTSTAVYTLTATDVNTCTNTAVTSITVNNLPVLSVTGSPSISCEAQTTTLTVSGAASYTWNTNENTPSIVIAPTVTTVYTVTAIDANTCKNTISYTQSVTPCPGVFTATVVKTDISCIGKDDGKIVITPATSYSNPVISYIWNPSSLCPGNNCDTLKHLASGTYNLKLKITYTVNGTLVKTDSLVLAPITLVDLSGACEVKIFNGITANGDGANDVFTIENIEQFPDNKVEVFNRWGQKVFEMKGYNNLDKAWPLKDDLGKLSPNTYFYIIDLGSGSKPIKGWIELLKN